MHHFCTYFDRNYLLRGLSAFRSLEQTGCDFVLHALALDEQCYATLVALKLERLRPVLLADIEAATPGLLAAKAGRSRIEYYFTLSPVLPLYLLEQHAEIERITYLDADLHFTASPDVLFNEMGPRSILVCEHRYSPHLKQQGGYGHFNVQFQSFRNNTAGLACLKRWRTQCIEWCHDYVDGDRYADQKYLDEWPALYGEQLAVVQHPGAGLAPWNWASAPLDINAGELRVGGKPLVFYHFHGLKIFNAHFISNGLADWGLMPRRPRRHIYGQYLRAIRNTREWLRVRTGHDYPVQDRFIRGKGISIASLGEIARKAWTQAMFFA